MKQNFPATFLGLLILCAPALYAHQPHDPIDVVAVSPNFLNDQTLIAATDFLSVSIGVYLPIKSTDGGNTWEPMRGLPNQPWTSIRFSPNYAQDGTVLMAGSGGLYRTTDTGTTWTQIAIAGVTAVQDAVFSPTYSSDNTVLAMTTSGVYRSTTQTPSFSPIAAPSSTGTFTVLAISPNFWKDETFAIGSSAGEVFLTNNAGVTYTNSTSGLGLKSISAIVFTPEYSQFPNILLASNGSGIYASANAGGSWQSRSQGITDLNVTDLALFPDYDHDHTMVATTQGSGVFLSATGGSAWTLEPRPYRMLAHQTTDHFRTIAVAPTSTSAAEIFLGMFEGLWRSTDLASTWQYSDFIPTFLVRDMKISATYATDQTIVATSYGGGTLVSSNGGNAWTFINTGVMNAYPDPVAISPNYDNDHVLFTGEFFGLEYTNNGGASWSTVPAAGVKNYPRSLAVSPNYANDGLVLIGLSNGESDNPPTVIYDGKVYKNEGLFYSVNGGQNWIPSATLNGPAVIAIAMSPAFPTDQTAFAGTIANGLWKSADGGKTWASTFDLSTDPQILSVALSPNYPSDQTAFASTSHSGIYETNDGGAHWKVLSNTVSLTAISLAVSPNFSVDHMLLAGTFESGLIVSTDSGQSFQPVNLSQNFITRVVFSPAFATDRTVFASAYAGIYKSSDGGLTWSFLGEPSCMDNDRIETVLLPAPWTVTPDPLSVFFNYSLVNSPTATGTIQFVGSGISWISRKDSAGGSATVSIDGTSYGSVSLNSPTTVEQQVIFHTDGLACTAHTAVFTPSSQAGQSQIYVDAVFIYRDGCSGVASAKSKK